MTQAPLTIAQLSLRERERGFVCGGTDSGKSTLADLLGMEFLARYQRRKARRLIADSKPRYRAEYRMNGLTAARLYKDWDHGPVVPGSMLVTDASDLAKAWTLGARTCIVQGESMADVPRLVSVVGEFLKKSKAGRPQLVQIDEVMDFYFPNGSARGGDDAILRTARAGRERGTAGLYCSQRTRQIPGQLMEEMTRAYVFQLDAVGDAKRFPEMGMPPFEVPTQTRQFMYWWKGDHEHPLARRTVWGPYHLNLGA